MTLHKYRNNKHVNECWGHVKNKGKNGWIKQLP